MSKPFCRICFEDGVIEHRIGAYQGEGLFRPCCCDGTNKWVHRNCLDQWRISADNREAYTKCMTCLTQYKLDGPNRSVNFINRVNRTLANNSCTLLVVNVILVMIGGMVIHQIDHKEMIAKWMDKFWGRTDDFYNNQSNDIKKTYHYAYYCLIFSYLYLFGVLFSLVINFLVMKNRRLYLRYLTGVKSCGFMLVVVWLVLMSTVAFFWWNLVVGIIFMSTNIQVILTNHYRYLAKFYKAQKLFVIPYQEEEQELELEQDIGPSLDLE